MDARPVIHITQDDKEQAAFIARIRQHSKSPQAQNHKIAPHLSDIRVHFLGALAEIAVSRALGCDVDTRGLAGGDDGVDLTWNGHTIQVKFNSLKYGDLRFNSLADFSADIAILVVPEKDDNLYIAGWLPRAEFEDRAQVKDFGYGKRLCVEQADLFPMKILMDERKVSASGHRQAIG